MTSTTQLVDRLAALPNMSTLPRAELAWLVAHGDIAVHKRGDVLAPKGVRIESLWILLSGHVAVEVDRGAGPRLVIEWRPGDVSGMLPYSRMIAPPGHNFAMTATEALTIHQRHFPEMVHRCPRFTAFTVHSMLDRARSFNTSDLQDEKMIALGKLAAGLAHELNNPASATVRGAKQLLAALDEADASARAVGAAGVTDEQLTMIGQVRTACLMQPGGTVLSALEQADREDAIADWLERHEQDPALAGALAGTAVTTDVLDVLANATSINTLGAALRWIASACTTHALAADIERAATRIFELVAAVKGFTYMDVVAAPGPVELEGGLRDTIRVVAAKARSKGAAINLDLEPHLPLVHASGSELNQIWLNLIDNALDAIGEAGRVDITARAERDRVVVRVIDDGPGIPADLLPKIFDPFFTTKPPGQGTGLGLDITQRLLRRHHGTVDVDSRPGRTEFRVSLIAEQPAERG